MALPTETNQLGNINALAKGLGNPPAVGNTPERRRAVTSQVTGLVEESLGTVTMYKADKGFGFAKQDGGGKDVFIHATALQRSGLGELVEGQRVRMQIG